MQTIFNNDKLFIEANPHYYDYCHEITLNNNTKSFNLSNGGGQHMEEMYNGHFELNDDTLILHFENEEDIYSNTIIQMNATNTLKYKIIQEEKKHFNGYSMRTSNYTIIFDKSLFAKNDEKYPADRYPLTFYTGFLDVECNTSLERFKRDREYFFTELFEDYPERIKDDMYTQNKNRYEKNILSVTDDTLINIMKIKDGLLNKNDTPLKFIAWLYNLDNYVVFYQRNMHTLFIVGPTEIQTWYYGYFTEDKKDDSRITMYEFPRDWNLIKTNILSNSNKANSDCDLLYENLQKFRVESSKLFDNV
jgi:hypothetical protein